MLTACVLFGLAVPLAGAERFWKPLGPYGHGHVSTFAFAPSRPGTVYAGILFGGGIRRSTDGGKTWLPANGNLDVDLTEVSQLTVDPRQPDTVYASIAGRGLFKTLDGGQTWAPLIRASTLAVSPVQPSLLFAGDRGHLLRSRDGGTTWQQLTAGLPERNYDVFALAVDPHHPRHVFAAIDDRAGGIFESFNGGDSWIQRSSFRAVRFLFDRDGPLYATDLHEKIRRSRDGGATWETVLNLHALPDVAMGGGGGGRPATLWASGENTVLRSDDQGAHWTETAIPPTQDETTFPLPLAASPGSPSVLLIGTWFDGAFRRIEEGPWEAVPGFGFLYISALERVPGALLAGGSGLYRSTDDGATWSLVRPDLLVTALAADPTDPRTVYAGISSSDFDDQMVWKSTDAGLTWSPLHQGLPAGNYVLSLAVDPRDSQTLFVATASNLHSGSGPAGLYKSIDAGEIWNHIAPDLFPSQIVLPQNDPGVLYAACGDSIRRSSDGGATWTLLLDGRVPDVNNFSLDLVAVSPSDPQVLYAAEAIGFSHPIPLVSTSRDRGATWTSQPTAPYLIIPSLAIDPNDPETVYIAVYVGSKFFHKGVWQSRNGGPWVPDLHGLRSPDVHTLFFDTAVPGRLLAGTSLGVFELRLEGPIPPNGGS